MGEEGDLPGEAETAGAERARGGGGGEDGAHGGDFLDKRQHRLRRRPDLRCGHGGGRGRIGGRGAIALSREECERGDADSNGIAI